MKNFKKVLALVLAVATLLSMATIASAKVTADYTDAEKVNYEEAVDVLGTMGVLDGYKDGSFKPAGTITRAEAAKIIAIFADYDTAAGKFYAAANKFSDVPAGNWAESYIAFAAQTGIIAGVGNGKFNPAGTLTGVQFLKMALCTLGLNAEKEGLIGSNWAVNTLKRAKELGLTDGIDKFDAAAALTREEAAQIMLNVLNTKTYTYGTQIVGNRRVSVLGNEVAIQGKDEYYKGYKSAKVGRAADDDDEFMRPGHVWTIDKTDLSYRDTPVYTFNNAPMSGCDLAVACGLPTSDTTTKVTVKYYEDGAYVNAKSGETLHHSNNNTCALAATTLGNVGAINEVYKLSDGTYRAVVINTYFGKVTDIIAASSRRNGHNTAEQFTMTDLNPANSGFTGNYTDKNTDGFKKGDYVLYTYSQKIKTGNTMYGVIDVDLATDSFEGKLTRDSTKVYSIDNVVETQAYGYGYDMAADATVGNYYTFFRDVYGNIIGATNAADKGSIVVIDYAYVIKEGNRGKNQIVADVVNFEDASIDTITISSYNNDVINGTAQGALCDTTKTDGAYGPKHDKLFKITEKSDGTYDATDLDAVTYDVATNAWDINKTNVSVGRHRNNEYANLGTSTVYMLAEGSAAAGFKYSIVDRAAFNKLAKAGRYTWLASDGIVTYILASQAVTKDASFMAYIYADDAGDEYVDYLTLEGDDGEVYCDSFTFTNAGWYDVTMSADGTKAVSIAAAADAPADATIDTSKLGEGIITTGTSAWNKVDHNIAVDFSFILFDTAAGKVLEGYESDLVGTYETFVDYNDDGEMTYVCIVK